MEVLTNNTISKFIRKIEASPYYIESIALSQVRIIEQDVVEQSEGKKEDAGREKEK